QANRGKGRTCWRNPPPGDGRKWVAPNELADRSRSDSTPPRHAEPRRRDMDVHDPDGIALEVVRRCQSETCRHSSNSKRETDEQQPGRGRPRETQKARGVGERMHCAAAHALRRPLSGRSRMARATSRPIRPNPFIATLAMNKNVPPSVRTVTRGNRSEGYG